MKNSLNEDIRWKQRFNSFIRALKTLDMAVKLTEKPDISYDESIVYQLAVIKSFEYTHELAWNVLKDYLEEQGFHNLIGSKDSSREAFKRGLIKDGETWMDMIEARNQTVHRYNEEEAEEIHDAICGKFHPAFEKMKDDFNKLYKKSNE